MYLLIFLVLVFALQMQLYLFVITGTIMEDALAASGLASAVIDVREYGMSHIIQIASPDAAYQLYREALKQNLGLGDLWEPERQTPLIRAVLPKQYIIYNVKKDDIEIYSYDENGECSSWTEYDGLGRVKAPDDTLIESTSVYSRVGFEVQGMLGLTVYAQKEKTVDIVSNLAGEEIV